MRRLAQPLVFNVQRFSIHDGPGIRTTVFFKGCPLNCLWCHNPESQAYQAQVIFYAERCAACGRCKQVCPAPQGPCLACGQCVMQCPSGAREVAGQRYSPQALCQLLLRDRAFYDTSGGGVTLSGGEPMAQDEGYLEALLKGLKRRGVHVCVDSCGLAPWARFARLLDRVDLFLMDFKALDDDLHRQLTGQGNGLILENLCRLSQAGAKMWLRVPVVPGGNLEDMSAMAAWAAEHLRPAQVNLLPYHRAGQDKGERLAAPPPHRTFSPPDQATLAQIHHIWTQAGQENVVIGG